MVDNIELDFPGCCFGAERVFRSVSILMEDLLVSIKIITPRTGSTTLLYITQPVGSFGPPFMYLFT